MNLDERQLGLLRSSLSACVSSLNLALDIIGGQSSSNSNFRRSKEEPRNDKPLITGVFDGISATCSDGKSYAVSPSYASRVGLVCGDTLKLDRVDGSGKAYFMQYKRVKRKQEEGVLAKKEGKWVVVISTGSYKLTPESVERWSAVEGDEAKVLIPEENLNAPYATIEEVKGRHVVELERKVEEKKVEKKEEVKKEKVEEKEKEEEKPVKKVAPKKKKRKKKKNRLLRHEL